MKHPLNRLSYNQQYNIFMYIRTRDAPDAKGEGAWRGPDPPFNLPFRNVPEPSPELLTPSHLHVLAQRMDDR